MKIEELDQDLQEQIRLLKHGSSTIEQDVLDALESADTLDNFKYNAKLALTTLIDEAHNAINYIC